MFIKSPVIPSPVVTPNIGGGFIPRYGLRGCMSPDGDPGASQAAAGGQAQPDPAPKTFTQDDLNRVAAERAERERKSLLSKLGVADLDEATRRLEAAKKLEADAEAARLKKLEEEGQYQSLLEETRTKKDAEIASLRTELEARDQRLKDADLNRELARLASKAVRPEQVVALLRAEGAIKLGADGLPMVVDQTGKQRLDDKGNPMTVDAYVNGWFASNPHHLPAQGLPGTGGGQGGTSQTKLPGATGTLDMAQVRSTAYLRKNIETARAARAERTKSNQGKGGFF